MNEAEFLKGYSSKDYAAPLVTVDSVLFTYHEQTLQILLVERGNHPEKGKWGLPGGFIDLNADEDVEATASRKLKEKTGVVPPYLEQLCSAGNAKRDQRGWSVTICYTALVAHQKCTAHVDTVSDVKWVEYAAALKLPLAFDHGDLMKQARERLRQKALYSIVPGYALPEKFTLTDLPQVHEILIGKELQKKSFRRRIEQAALLIDTGEKRYEGGRPAALYKLRAKSASFTFVRNLEE
jgi:8-oxo-dGTP diphosphatase